MSLHKEKANAKINLVLDIKYKREDGYHELFTIMQEVDLFDTLIFKKTSGSDITIDHNIENLPKDSNNIICKAAFLLKKRYRIEDGIHIILDKKIPVGAGLGGGSSNAAAVIRAFNAIYSLNLSKEEMEEVANLLGADVPFFINGGLQKCEGTGEILEPLTGLKKLYYVLVNPGIMVSTKWAYENYRKTYTDNELINKKILKAVLENDYMLLSKNLYNDLESVTIEKYPVLDKIKRELLNNKASMSMMSGSGSTVFGLFENNDNASAAAKKITEKFTDMKVIQVKAV
jgi:4-diphosphocytidyl-2-C-methyl-D-erythritol kinase